jgi:lauroyl/myristoyl acyltransferase
MTETSAIRPHNERWFYRRLYSSDIFEFTCRVFPFLGRGVYRSVARGIARTYAWTQPGVVTTVQRNLGLLEKREVPRSLARQVFVSFATSIADYIAAGNTPIDQADAWCTERGGIEHLQEARDAGRGAILATGHYGFFEFGSLVLGRMGWPVSIVTLSEPTPQLTDWRAAFRKRWGAETIEIGPDAFSSLRVMRVLEAGGFAAMLIDRPHGDHVTPVALKGGTIPFSLSPALLAYMSDVPVIPVVVAATPDGGYRLIAKPGIWPRRLGLPREAAVKEATVQVAHALVEEFIRDPSQWYQFPPLTP